MRTSHDTAEAWLPGAAPVCRSPLVTYVILAPAMGTSAPALLSEPAIAAEAPKRMRNASNVPVPLASSERIKLHFAFELILPFVIFKMDPVNFTDPVSVNLSVDVVQVPESFPLAATLITAVTPSALPR